MIYLIALFTLLFRLLATTNPILAGITPLFALFFLTKSKDFPVILFTNILTDLAISSYWGLISPLSFIPSIFAIGYFLLSKFNISSLSFIFGGTLIHYLITNSISWAIGAVYAKDFAGWIQANTLGDPNFAPAYLFFVKMALGNIMFYLMFSKLLAIKLDAPILEKRGVNE